MYLTKCQFWSRVKPDAPSYPPEIQAERDELLRAIQVSKKLLDDMFTNEQQLRMDYLGALEMLAYQTEIGHFKVNTRTWDDATLDEIWAEMKEKEAALRNQIENIHLAQLEIRDAEKIYNDPESWTPDATAQLVARRKALTK